MVGSGQGGLTSPSHDDHLYHERSARFSTNLSKFRMLLVRGKSYVNKMKMKMNDFRDDLIIYLF